MKLEELPDEILVKIIDTKCLLAEDLLSFKKVSLRFKDICSYQSIWKSKFQQRWPWTWDKIQSGFFSFQVFNNWEKETVAVLAIIKKLNNILDSLSYELYKYKNITSPVLAPVFELFKIGSFGPLHILNELREIVCNKRETDLTKQYYSKLVLYQVNQYLCKWELTQFFKLSPQRQSLEKGAYYLSKWFQPEESLNIDFHQISSKLDDLAREVQSHLKKKHKHHPAIHIQLFSPEEPLENAKWTEEECEELFESVNYVLFAKFNFRGNDDYYVIQNSLLNRVLETKMGIPVTLSIIYEAVCHRLGIPLQPVNCPSHFLLKWKVPTSGKSEFIDSFSRGKKLSEISTELTNLTSFNTSDCECSTLEVLMRMSNNTLYVAQRNMHGFDLDTDILSAAGILLFLDPENTDILEFVYRLYLSCELHVDAIVEGCKNLIKEKPTLRKRYSDLKKEAEILLAIQEKGPRPVRPKRRTENIRFATGMVMSHKLYGYSCVIFGWDETCEMPMEWIVRMNVLALEHRNHQPFYNVLVSDGSHRYAAQENLIPMDESIPITHSEIGKYFKEFRIPYYIPNEELRSEYPDDEDVRTERLTDSVALDS